MTAVIVDALSSPGVRPPGPGPTRSWHTSPAHPAGRPALAALFTVCSPETVRLRFFGQLREWPREYLDGALAAPPEAHDAVVAYGTSRANLVGLASLAAPSPAGPGIGELGVLVADAWQRQGAAIAMLDLLFARARTRGVDRVAATVLPGRSELLAALARHMEPDGSRRSRVGLTGIYRLTPRVRSAETDIQADTERDPRREAPRN
jgi:GNAT superfamily N-acetyltransferase